MDTQGGRHVKASDRAYQWLREDIVEWRLKPGTVLAEVEQAERLGVSRTPLREALGRLSNEGLTTSHKGRGVVVSEVSLDDITEMFEFRRTLECTAAGLAAERGNSRVFLELRDRFEHAAALLESDPTGQMYYELVADLDAAIDEAMGNSYLLQSLNTLRPHMVRIRRLARDHASRLLASAREHATIASTIASGDSTLAEAATTIHLHNSLEYLGRVLRSQDSALEPDASEIPLKGQPHDSQP